MIFPPEGSMGIGTEANMVWENDHFSSAKTRREGLRRESAWNSPISARSFPKIEKASFSSCSGIRWAFSHPAPWAFVQVSAWPGSFLWVGGALDLEPGVGALSLAIVWDKYWRKKNVENRVDSNASNQHKVLLPSNCFLLLFLGNSQFTLPLHPAGCHFANVKPLPI